MLEIADSPEVAQRFPVGESRYPEGPPVELIRNILDHKGYELLTVAAEEHVMDALRTMTDRNVGSLLVFEGQELRGILTERDFVRWAARAGKRVPPRIRVRPVRMPTNLGRRWHPPNPGMIPR